VRRIMIDDGDTPRYRLLTFTIAIGGLAWFAIQAIALNQRWSIPGGDISDVYLAAGHAIRDGISPYYLPGNPTPFFYAPPWAVFFAAISFLDPRVVYVLVVGAEVAALRYMAGSWRGFCYLLWFPFLPFELLGGAINLIVAAAIVAAVRGHAWLAIAGTLAKVTPILAADPRRWRRYVPPLLIALLVTVPWPWLWGAWLDALTAALTGPPLGPLVPVPFAVRLPVGLVLVATGRPWARALGAAIAIPAFYFISVVLLIAPISIWAESNRRRAIHRSDGERT
jgi:hypothetical protein